MATTTAIERSTSLQDLLARYSTFSQLVREVAWLKRFIEFSCGV